MPCMHLKELYRLCQENEIRIGALDVVRLTCNQCNVKDVCPSVLTDEFDAEDRKQSKADSPAEPQKL